MEKIYTYDPRKNKIVLAGKLIGGVFVKKVLAKHYMRKERGYGISEQVLEQLVEKGCRHIIILTKINKYTSKIEKWFVQKSKNYGHGQQRFLPVMAMKMDY